MMALRSTASWPILWFRVETLWATEPGKIFGLPVNGFGVGDPADFFLLDPEEKWVVSRETMHSKSLNTPFLGRELVGKVKALWLERLLARECQQLPHQTGGTVRVLMDLHKIRIFGVRAIMPQQQQVAMP